LIDKEYNNDVKPRLLRREQGSLIKLKSSSLDVKVASKALFSKRERDQIPVANVSVAFTNAT